MPPFDWVTMSRGTVVHRATGAGLFARNTPKPVVTRTVNLSMHLVFGLSLFGTWLLAQVAALQGLVQQGSRPVKRPANRP